ncbi:MAG TPA: ABC transporter substrate-binding protein [Mycobacteriales bacterium]|nr:ABC transporter substrate-binding protein [Mycobacteriales bacterium]
MTRHVVTPGSRRPGGLLIAAATALALASTACGARLPGDVRSQAERAALSQRVGAVAAPQAAEPTAAAPNPVTSGGTVLPPVGSGSGVPSAAAPGPGSVRSAAASAAPTTGSGPDCSGGTDVGLTASTLALGEVVTLTGPVSGLFQGAEQGGEAFANYVNSTSGGICGRQVKVDIADDGTNCTQDENATQSLAGKTFALSGTFALYDGCGASIVKANPGIADIHVALDPSAYIPANHFDVTAGGNGYGTGMFQYYKQKLGSKLDHVGTIVEDIPSAVEEQQNQVRSAEAEGWHFVDSILEQPTNSNFQNDFVKLCQQEHIQVFFELTETAANAATMVQNEHQAGCPSSLVNIIPIAYDQAFLADYSGPASQLDGILGWNSYALFFNKDEATRIPEVKTFQDWFERTYPGQPINLYAMYAWADDRLFQQAAESVHGTLDRKTLMSSLRRIKDFDANGLIAPVSPAAKGGPHCYILWELENGGFQRVDDPKSGYRCDGRFLAKGA